MKLALIPVAFVATVLAATPAAADVATLNFEGIAPYPNGNDVQVLDFYNGGTSSIGTSGTNYGISFGSNATVLCLNTPGTSCSNTSRGGLAPGSEFGGLVFFSGDQTYMNVASGFDTGFSFNYASNNTPGFVNVYDGLNGTGNILATIMLPVNAPGCTDPYFADYCPYGPAGIAFAGTAHSVGFGGVANFITFDDITIGSATPGGGVPEPATWAMMLLGFGAIGVSMRQRRVVTAHPLARTRSF